MKKRALSILLVLCMFVSLLPVSAFAADEEEAAAPEAPAVETADTGDAPAQGGEETPELPQEQPQELLQEPQEEPETPQEPQQQPEALPEESFTPAKLADDAPAAGSSSDNPLAIASGETVSVSLTGDEALWLRFTPPTSASWKFDNPGGYMSFELYDSAMNCIESGTVGGSDAEPIGPFWLNSGEAYSLCVRAAGDTLDTTLTPIFANEFDAWNDPDVRVNPGNSVLLWVYYSCQDSSQVNFAWYGPDGSLLAQGPSQSYEISNAQQAGTYTCRVTDGYGYDSTLEFHLRIDNGFYLEYDSDEVARGKTGDEMHFAVEPYGYELSYNTYRWYMTDENGDWVLLEGVDGRDYWFTFDGTPRAYKCEAEDAYGNQDYLTFETVFENHFSAVPVTEAGWTVDEENHIVSILLPVDNDGVTLAMDISADVQDQLTVDWMFADGTEEPDNTVSEDGRTLTLGHVGCRTEYRATVDDGHDSVVQWLFAITVDNGLTVVPVDLDPSWTVDENGRVQIVLPPDNAGVTLAVDAHANDEEGLIVNWYVDNVYNMSAFDTLTIPGPIQRDTSVEIHSTDKYNTIIVVYFDIRIDNQLSIAPVVPDGVSYTVENRIAGEEDWWLSSGEPFEHITIHLPSSHEDFPMQLQVSALEPDRVSVEDINNGELTGENGRYTVSVIPSGSNNLSFYLRANDGCGDTADHWVNIEFSIRPELPTDVMEVTPGGSVVPLSAPAGEALWLHFTVDTEGDWNYRLDPETSVLFQLFDADMNELGSPRTTTCGSCYLGNLSPRGYYLRIQGWNAEENTPAALETGFSLSLDNYFQAWAYNWLSVDPGEEATLDVYVDARDLSRMSYAWYDPDGVLLAETTESSYTFTPTLTGTYLCHVEDGWGNSEDVEFYVNINNSFYLHPTGDTNAYCEPGQKASFSVRAIGRDITGVTYQWYQELDEEHGHEWIPLSGETGTGLTVTFDGTPATYLCEGTDRYGNIETSYFFVWYQTHLKVTPVLTGGWTSAYAESYGDENAYKITLPVDNDGVTMQVTASSDFPDKLSFNWVFEDGQEAQVLGPTDTDTLTLGPVSSYVRYTVNVEDGYGQSVVYSFYVYLDNGFTVEPVIPEGSGWVWNTDLNGPDYVDAYVAPNNEGMTLEVVADAIDTSGMTYQWYRYGELLEGETGSRLVLTEPIEYSDEYYVRVTDRFGTTIEVVFGVIVDNQLSITPVIPENSPYTWSYTPSHPGDHGEHVTILLPKDNQGLKLQVRADALDRSTLVVTDATNSAELTPEASDPTLYTVVDLPVVTQAQTYQIQARDDYGNSHWVLFYVTLDNGFSVNGSTASDQYKTILVGAGKTAKLSLNIQADDKSQMKITWYKGDSMYGESETMLSNTGTSLTTPAINASYTRYRAYVYDGFGNYTNIHFNILVNNKLDLSSTMGTAIGNNPYYRRITVDPGASVTLKVTATATNTKGIKYQWYSSNGGPIEGATKSSYVAGPMERYSTYYVVATDRYGNRAEMHFQVYIENHFTAYAAGTELGRVTNYYPLGSEVTLSVDVSGDNLDGLSCYWVAGSSGFDTNDRAIVPGADELSITFTLDKSYTYECWVTDPYGTLSVIMFEALVENGLRVQPLYTDWWYVPLGESVSLTVLADADNTEDLRYQWYTVVDTASYSYNSRIEGETASTYWIPDVEGPATYICQVTDVYGTVISQVFNVWVDNQLSVKAAKDTVTVKSGAKATLKVTATAANTKGLKYQWFTTTADGSPKAAIKGATKASYTTGAVKKAATYLCRVTDTLYNGPAQWVPVRVQVQNKLKLTAVTAQEIYVPYGEDATMTVKATATTTKGIKYQWYALLPPYEGASYDEFRWEAIEGATGTSFTQDGVTEAIEFLCEVTDKYGNQASCWFLTGVDNGFTVASADGKYAYTVFKDTDVNLAVDLQIDDDTDLQDGWEVQVPNGSNPFWADLENEEYSFSFTIPEETTLTFRFWAMDRYSLIQSATFTVKVISLTNYTPAAPVLVKRPSIIDVQFDPIEVAESYRIQRKTGTGKYVTVADNLTLGDGLELTADGKLQWSDTSVKNATKYTYRLLAENEDGVSKAGKTAALTYYKAPVLKTPAVTTSGIKLTWGKVSGASYYKVYRRDLASGTSVVVAKKVSGTSYVDKTAPSGTYSIYVVQALNAKAKAISSESTPATSPYYLAAPALPTLSVTREEDLYGVTVKWTAVAGATGYRLLRKLGTGAWTPIGETDGETLSFHDDTAANKKTYSYTVQALGEHNGEAVESKYNTTGKSVTFYAAPVISSITAAKTGATIKWGKVSGATYYRVLRWDMENQKWVQVATKISGTSYTYKGAVEGEFYTVQALNAKAKPISSHDSGIEFRVD